MYEYMVRACDGDEGVVWRDLLHMGYNDRLKLVGARTIVVSAHTTNEVGAGDAAGYQEIVLVHVGA